MHTITLDGQAFFDPRADTHVLGTPKLIREANKIGTLTFTVYPQHPAYGTIKILRSIFSIYKDGKLIYKGRPAYSKRAFRNGIDYKCEEVTSAMNDFKFRPAVYSGPVDQLFLNVLASYNSRAWEILFNPGTIQNPGTIEWGKNNGYMGHWDVLQSFVTKFGGYIIPRYEGDKIYIDWLTEDDLPNASQEIRFGENMTDMFIETDAINSFSGIIPIGGVPEGGEDKIDITSVNNGSDVLYNEDAVDLYGMRETTKEWNEITDPAKLKEAANEWIRGSTVKFKQSVKLTAVDMHYTNASIESLPFMAWVRAVSSRHDLSTQYILSREEVQLNTPLGTKITLGDTRPTFTEALPKS